MNDREDESWNVEVWIEEWVRNGSICFFIQLHLELFLFHPFSMMYLW